MDSKTSQPISTDEVSPVSLANDFQQILHDIGFQMSCLSHAVTALADQNTSLADTSLENCKGVLKEMFQGQEGLAQSHAIRHDSHDHTEAWIRDGAALLTEVVDVDGKVSVPTPKASEIEKKPKVARISVESAKAMESITKAISFAEIQEGSSSSSLQESKPYNPKEPRKSSDPDTQMITHIESESKDSQEQPVGRKKSKFDDSYKAMRKSAAKVMNSRKAEALVGTLIVANAVVLGHQSDFAVGNLNEQSPVAYRVLDIFFTCAFTIELAIRFLIDGSQYFFDWANKDRNWNVFDLLMVLSAIVEEFVGMLVEGSTANISAVRVLRLLRLARVIRVIRVMRVFQDLRLMVAGIVSCAKPLAWALCLLFLIMFCVAVCILQFASAELEAEGVASVPSDFEERYGSLGSAISTLYMSITGGIDWIEATEPLIDISKILVFFFYCYVAFAILCCLNIVTGVFVENAHKMSARDEDFMIMEEMEKHRYWMEDVKRAFAAADQDGSGVIDLDEFREFQEDPRMQAFLRRLGVDWSMEDADKLFKQLDFDNTGTIVFDEFIMAIQKLTGATRAMDMINLVHDAKITKHQVAQILRNQESRNSTNANDLSNLGELHFTDSRETPSIFSVGRNRSTLAFQPARQTVASELSMFGPCTTEQGSKQEVRPQKERLFQVRPPSNPPGHEFAVLSVPESHNDHVASFAMPGSLNCALEFEDVDGHP